MSIKLKKRIRRTIVGAIIFLVGMLYLLIGRNVNHNAELIIFLVAYLIAGGDVVRSAFRNIGNGQLFDETFLMTVASVGAFFVGSYPEAAAVMIFYQIGECFQAYAVNHSRKSIATLMDIRPDSACVLRDGVEVIVDPEEVSLDEIIQVRPGEKVPLDAVVLQGNSSIDTMALTGESIPRDVQPGDTVVSGCVNLSGVIQAKVIKIFEESTVNKILNLVENSSSKKAAAENFITKFSRYYTPIVVFAAIALAVIPSLITRQPEVWIYRALSFLVISCPCAFVVSVPLTFFGGLGAASKEGILVKGANYLEALSKANIIVMDKTGTLTQGVFSVQKIEISKDAETEGITEDRLLELTAMVESFSNHPISKSVLKAYGKKIDTTNISNVQELAGLGVKANIDGIEISAGNEKMMQQNAIPKMQEILQKSQNEIGTLIHVAKKDKYLGYLVIADTIRSDAALAISQLYSKSSIKKIVMLTGDQKKTAESVAELIGIKDYEAHLLPSDKVEKVENLLQENNENGQLIFVGDGINDAPVLARADIGIAMGGIGSDAAIEAADVVIMDDQLVKIPSVIAIAKRTVQIAMQNSIFAIFVKILILLLATVGLTSMWAAIFADVGVTFIAVLNAMRALKAPSVK